MLPRAAGRPRADPRAAAASPDRPHAGRRRLRRGGQLPVRRRRHLRRARAARRRRAAPRRPAVQPAVGRGAARTRRRCCPGVLDAAARNLGRGAPGVALFETGTVAFPVDRGPAPIYGVDWRPTEAELGQAVRRAARAAAVPRRRAGRRARARRLVGRRARRRLVRRRRGRPRASPPSSASRSRSAGRSRMPWHPGRCALVCVGDEELGHAGELHPRVCQAFGLPRGTAALEIDLDVLMARARRRPAAARRSRPTRWPRRTSRSSSTTSVHRRRRSRRRCAPAPATCSSRCGSSTSTPARRSARASKSLAFALRFRAPDRTLTEAETGAARDAAVAARRRAVGAVQR